MVQGIRQNEHSPDDSNQHIIRAHCSFRFQYGINEATAFNHDQRIVRVGRTLDNRAKLFPLVIGKRHLLSNILTLERGTNLHRYDKLLRTHAPLSISENRLVDESVNEAEIMRGTVYLNLHVLRHYNRRHVYPFTLPGMIFKSSVKTPNAIRLFTVLAVTYRFAIASSNPPICAQ